MAKGLFILYDQHRSCLWFGEVNNQVAVYASKLLLFLFDFAMLPHPTPPPPHPTLPPPTLPPPQKKLANNNKYWSLQQ